MRPFNIVECRDCKHACFIEVEDYSIICLNWACYVDPDGWCYKGERK